MLLKRCKMYIDVDMTCFGVEGINALKTATEAAHKVEIKMMAAPLYRIITITAVNENTAKEILKDAYEVCKQVLEKHSGIIIKKTSIRKL